MTIRWGMIGCGDVAEVKSGPGFQQAEGSSLIAVMRRDGNKSQEYARRHNVPYWYDNADSILHHPEVDALYIATPPGSHLQYALAAAAAGKPTYVEKPMARCAVECERMNAAFDAAGIPLFVAFYRRALPRFIKAREIIESGQLGHLTGVRYAFMAPAHRREDSSNLPWRLRAQEAGGGLFLDLGCHTLDILDFMLGPLQNVTGQAANIVSEYDVEDSVIMQFTTATGALGSASWNFASDQNEDLIEVIGTDGILSLSTFGNEPLGLRRADKRTEFDLANPLHIQQPLIQTIVNQLRGTGSCPSTGHSAARTARIMDSALDAYYAGRQDAFWDRPHTWPGRHQHVNESQIEA